ncbi:glycosyltransferase [Neorhodopirellula lusitana]|uniref:glycosyltransferase n=1 Tax=Neorhodopirellula lusitana TaxID=445327 RepID=UPI00384DE986
MLDAGFRADKIICIENRFENGETMPAPPAPNAKRNIAFIGRLRPGCEIEMLLDALTQINSERIVPVELHVIGDGPSLDQLRTATSDRNWVTWHGEITSQQQIEAIVSDCTIGAYPGRAGLSAIEYMRYGLACVFADDMSYHMGPEPSHVKNGYNGWTFKAESIDDLRDTLAVALNSDRLQESRVNAHSTFQEIHRMSYGDEMAKLLIG